MKLLERVYCALFLLIITTTSARSFQPHGAIGSFYTPFFSASMPLSILFPLPGPGALFPTANPAYLSTPCSVLPPPGNPPRSSSWKSLLPPLSSMACCPMLSHRKSRVFSVQKWSLGAFSGTMEISRGPPLGVEADAGRWVPGNHLQRC